MRVQFLCVKQKKRESKMWGKCYNFQEVANGYESFLLSRGFYVILIHHLLKQSEALLADSFKVQLKAWRIFPVYILLAPLTKQLETSTCKQHKAAATHYWTKKAE